MFRAQPLAWISLTSSWFIVSFLMVLIPLLGAPAMTMCQPAFFAGFVLACRDQEMGKAVAFSHLFAGFRANGRALIQIGSVSLLAELAIMLVLSAFGFFDGLRAIDRENPSIEVIAGALREQGGLWFAAAAAIVVIKGVLWFTAALMVYQPMPASHAIRWSFFALVGNVIPLTLFALFMLGLMFIAVLPWFLGMLVFVPIYAISHYTSFKAVFRDDVE